MVTAWGNLKKTNQEILVRFALSRCGDFRAYGCVDSPAKYITTCTTLASDCLKVFFTGRTMDELTTRIKESSGGSNTVSLVSGSFEGVSVDSKTVF